MKGDKCYILEITLKGHNISTTFANVSENDYYSVEVGDKLPFKSFLTEKARTEIKGLVVEKDHDKENNKYFVVVYDYGNKFTTYRVDPISYYFVFEVNTKLPLEKKFDKVKKNKKLKL